MGNQGWAAANSGRPQAMGGRRGHAPVRSIIDMRAGCSPVRPFGHRRRFRVLSAGVLCLRFLGRVMPAISPERMRDRYETILAAASRAFAEKGYETTSITEIARAAEVSDGLIYKYFSNKRDLLEHVLRKFYERLIEDVDAKVARGGGFREQFYILISEHLSTFVAQRDLCRLFISEVRIASDYRGSAIQQLNRRYTSILIKMVDDAVASGEIPQTVDPRVVRDMMFGAIEHSAWRHTIGKRPLDVQHMARTITEIFLNGLCPNSAKAKS
jgi:TetR/AcrR family transcriptional regulator, fatty acid metabolism regulator protein